MGFCTEETSLMISEDTLKHFSAASGMNAPLKKRLLRLPGHDRCWAIAGVPPHRSWSAGTVSRASGDSLVELGFAELLVCLGQRL